MTDDLDPLRSFRSDLGGTDADAIARIRTTVADRTTITAHRTTGDDAATGGSSVATLTRPEPDLPYVSLADADHEESPRASRRPRRRQVFAGAAAALLLLVGAVAWFSADDPPEQGVADVVPDEDATEQPAPSTIPVVAPTSVPDGFSLTGVVRPEASEVDAAGVPTWTIYTPAGMVGPDAPQALMVSALGPVVEGFGLSEREPSDATLVEVGRGSALLRESGDIVSLELELDGQTFRVVGRGLDTDTVLEAAATASAAADGTGSLAEEALPDGWALQSTRPQVPVGASLAYMRAEGAGDDGANPSIVFSWSFGTAEDVATSRLLIDESAVGCGGPCPLVGGNPSVVGQSIFSETEPGSELLQLTWVDDGVVFRIDGTGVPLGEMYVMAESLTETTWEALEAQLPR